MDEKYMMDGETIDLTNCDREPIHIPGSVQAHAWMLVFDADLKVQHTSANTMEMAGVAPEKMLRRSIEELFGPEDMAFLRANILNKPLGDSPHYLPLVRVGDKGLLFEGVAHRRGELLILELETGRHSDAKSQEEVYGTLKHTLVHLQGTRSVKAFCQSAAEHVREFTGFDRVMVYQFAPDDSGLVIAEARRSDLGTYLGHHYPASDIPKQARALFKKSQLRLNPDVSRVPVVLVPQLQRSGEPVDMSFCVTRSVSPIHVEYLQNLGVHASLSISIVVGDKLWGLFACHHYSARYVDHPTRMACEFLAHMLSLQVGTKEAEEQREYADILARRHTAISEHLREDEDFDQILALEPGTTFCGIQASGAAVIGNGRLHVRGRTPAESGIRHLARWLDQYVQDGVWSTDRLVEHLQDRAVTDVVSGVLAARVSKSESSYIFWFRTEVPFVIAWAGDPNKPVLPGPRGDRLTPRKSFEIWREEIKGKSEPWLACELATARSLRHSVLEATMRRAEQLMRFNAELEERNRQLDSFAYVASHDLKEPLRGIHNFSQFLIEDYASKLDEEGVAQLRTVVRLTERMEALLDSLLYYSRLSRAELAANEVDVERAFALAKEMTADRIQARGMELRKAGPLAPARGDEGRVVEIFTNLLSNAAKYNDKPDAWVEVGCEFAERKTPVYYVRDNGIGISEQNLSVIFRIFKRLHGREDFGGGVGAGLTIVRKIVERHGGRIWVDSSPGKGTTFYFTLAPDIE